MFESWKEKRAEKKAKDKAIRESQYWKNNALLPDCLQSMRGSCTLAPVEMHEAAIAVVNIALREDIWTTLAEISDIPEDFFDGILYIVWDEAHLPVLKAVGKLVDENLYDVRCVNHHTFLVTETLDRIIWFDGLGQIKLYSIAS